MVWMRTEAQGCQVICLGSHSYEWQGHVNLYSSLFPVILHPLDKVNETQRKGVFKAFPVSMMQAGSKTH